ncbi:hypothetical protein KIPB_010163, partial [Kipferlia bialata]
DSLVHAYVVGPVTVTDTLVVFSDSPLLFDVTFEGTLSVASLVADIGMTEQLTFNGPVLCADRTEDNDYSPDCSLSLLASSLVPLVVSFEGDPVPDSDGSVAYGVDVGSLSLQSDDTLVVAFHGDTRALDMSLVSPAGVYVDAYHTLEAHTLNVTSSDGEVKLWKTGALGTVSAPSTSLSLHGACTLAEATVDSMIVDSDVVSGTSLNILVGGTLQVQDGCSFTSDCVSSGPGSTYPSVSSVAGVSISADWLVVGTGVHMTGHGVALQGQSGIDLRGSLSLSVTSSLTPSSPVVSVSSGSGLVSIPMDSTIDIDVTVTAGTSQYPYGALSLTPSHADPLSGLSLSVSDAAAQSGLVLHTVDDTPLVLFTLDASVPCLSLPSVHVASTLSLTPGPSASLSLDQYRGSVSVHRGSVQIETDASVLFSGDTLVAQSVALSLGGLLVSIEDVSMPPGSVSLVDGSLHLPDGGSATHLDVKAVEYIHMHHWRVYAVKATPLASPSDCTLMMLNMEGGTYVDLMQ